MILTPLFVPFAGTLDQARTITAASLEGRAFFNLHNRPAFLQIDPIRLEDAGDYRCRVGKCPMRGTLRSKSFKDPQASRTELQDSKICISNFEF